jgi:hypothetical protein
MRWTIHVTCSKHGGSHVVEVPHTTRRDRLFVEWAAAHRWAVPKRNVLALAVAPPGAAIEATFEGPPGQGSFGARSDPKHHTQRARGSRQRIVLRRGDPSGLVMADPAKRRELTVFEKHQLRVARQTLRMPDQAVGILGGPTKEEAREIIRKLTGRGERRDASRPPSHLARLLAQAGVKHASLHVERLLRAGVAPAEIEFRARARDVAALTRGDPRHRTKSKKARRSC